MVRKERYNSTQVGLNTDSTPTEVTSGEYTHALNAVVINDEGDGNVKLQNEPSNLLCRKFEDGYMVIGREYDPTTDKVYVFLTNPDTEYSEIGVIDLDFEYLQVDETVDCGCDKVEVIKEKLEDMLQYPLCNYTQLISDLCDDCVGCAPCLNFSIYNPIKDGNIVLKTEKCGRVLYWTDGENPTRRLELDNLDYYKEEGYLMCNEDTRKKVCVNCERLLLRTPYSKPCLTPVKIAYGGNLPMGVYEYAIAGCDKFGNEFTPYFSAVREVSIFNENSVVMDQTQTADRTNLGVLLQVEWNDPHIQYYKIAVVQTTSSAGESKTYVEGIHPISDKNVTHYTDQDKLSITIQKLLVIPPNYKKSRMMTTSNGYLFEGGLTVEKPWNLQPVVAMLGAFALWQTVEGNEELYKDGVKNSLFKSTLRDEVYPYALRLTSKEGYITDSWALASRPSVPNDPALQLVNPSSDKNVKSVQKFMNTCADNTRLYRYQYYNTAEELTGYENQEALSELSEECDVIPYKVGKFAYHESAEKYPDNQELFNAQNLKIEPSDIPDKIRADFEKYFTSGTNADGTYILNDNANFACKPIRHFRFPDFNVSPFMSTDDANAVYLIVTPGALQFQNTNAGAQTITVASNTTWTAVVNDSWISYNQTTGQVTVSNNPSLNSRTGSITFKTTDGTVTKVLYITQQAESANITIDPATLEFANTGNAPQVLTVTVNTEWAATTSSSWIHFDKSTGQVTVDDNTGINQRNGSIVFTTTDGTSSFTVTVSQKANVSLSISPKTVTFESSGGADQNIIVSTSTTWNAVPDKPWIHFDKAFGSVSVDDNTSTDEREGQVVFTTTDGSASAVLIVKQKGTVGLSVTPDTLQFAAHSGLVKSLTITGGQYTVEISEDWIFFNDNNTSVMVTENNTLNLRTGTITFKTLDGTISIVINIVQTPI